MYNYVYIYIYTHTYIMHPTSARLRRCDGGAIHMYSSML